MLTLSVCFQAPVVASQSRTVSSEADARTVLSSEKATAFAQCLWPLSVCFQEGLLPRLIPPLEGNPGHFRKNQEKNKPPGNHPIVGLCLVFACE